MKKTCKVSVVIPVYNIPRNALECCVNSVLSQDYSNIEIFLVDDGSSDDCSAICDELSKKDERLVVIHKNNEGVSSARNNGLLFATGKYILFVDADDGLHQQAISIMVALAETNNADITVCDYKRFYTDWLPNDSSQVNDNVNCLLFECPSELISLRKKCLIEDGSLGARFNGAPWAKLYSLNLLKDNNLLFDVSLIRSQDNYFNFQAFCYSKINCYVPIPLYYYRYMPQSSVNRFRQNLYDISDKYIQKITAVINLNKDKNEYLETLNRVRFEKTSELCMTNIAHPNNEAKISDKCELLKKVRYTWLLNINENDIKKCELSFKTKCLIFSIIRERYKLACYISRLLFFAKVIYNKIRILRYKW